VNIIELLTADHRSVERLLERIEDAEGEDRAPLVTALDTALQAHMKLEEDHLYGMTAELLGDEMAAEAHNEHDVARTGLVELKKLAPDEPGFGAALDMVKAGIGHHVEDEEDDLFPQLRERAGDRLRQIEADVMADRRRLGLPLEADEVTGSAGLSAMTRDELYEKAREADVEGRSSMTKDELAEALDER
jgi:iron-sulfur cluster repair protein YtfE (RIC family)